MMPEMSSSSARAQQAQKKHTERQLRCKRWQIKFAFGFPCIAMEFLLNLQHSCLVNVLIGEKVVRLFVCALLIVAQQCMWCMQRETTVTDIITISTSTSTSNNSSSYNSTSSQHRNRNRKKKLQIYFKINSNMCCVRGAVRCGVVCVQCTSMCWCFQSFEIYMNGCGYYICYTIKKKTNVVTRYVSHCQRTDLPICLFIYLFR